MKNKILIFLVSVFNLIPNLVFACRLENPDYAIEKKFDTYKFVIIDGFKGGIGLITGKRFIEQCGFVDDGYYISFILLLAILVGIVLIALLYNKFIINKNETKS